MKRINIRPTTSVYATYKNMKYYPWTAIAEFVDNSTQSYFDNIDKLKNTKYWKGLEIEIQYSSDGKYGEYLLIKDNAYGMNFKDFKRAIILDSPPGNPSRSEFGMGLKTAACWFGLNWSVKSIELGSSIEYYTSINVDLLSKYKQENIDVEEKQCSKKTHGTEIKIWNMNRRIYGKQIKKIKDQLRGIYRKDLNSGDITIFYNGEALQYEEPEILHENLPDGNKKEWKKEISFTIDHNNKKYYVNGFVALREKGNISEAGFALMRRNRAIVGGYQNAFRPEEIFGKSNTFVYQRLFGELNLDDWPVTQTKDGFDWYDGLEEKLIDILLKECKEYIDKAENYRVRDKKNIEIGMIKVGKKFERAGLIQNMEIKEVLNSDVSKFDSENTLEIGVKDRDSQVEGFSSAEQNSVSKYSSPFNNEESQMEFEYNKTEYRLKLKTEIKDPLSQWLSIVNDKKGENDYEVVWNVGHGFFKTYLDNPESFFVLKQLIFALTLAEIDSRQTSVNGEIDPSSIRVNINNILDKMAMEEYNG